MTEIEGKIPSIAGLATTRSLNVVENQISNVSDLVKKTDCDAKISDIKYFITSDCNAKIKETRLIDKFDIYGLVDKSDLEMETISLITKAE